MTRFPAIAAMRIASPVPPEIVAALVIVPATLRVLALPNLIPYTPVLPEIVPARLVTFPPLRA